jgi:HAD superfamily phosphatase (TIGR01681 family)
MDSTDSGTGTAAVEVGGIPVVKDEKAKKPKGVKCVVWDLDHTVWDGILLEDERVELRPGVLDIIRTLDERGILQSVASKNDHDRAMARLEALGIAEFFLHPQINWSAKGQNVEAIAKALKIGISPSSAKRCSSWCRRCAWSTRPTCRRSWTSRR